MNKLTTYKPEDILVATIDTQCCFMPASEGNRLKLQGFGELPVDDAQEIIPVLNRLDRWAAAKGILRVATMDWHPAVTAHFGIGPGQWALHAVAGSPGAKLHPRLRIVNDASVLRFKKGVEPIEDPSQDDSYSGFNAKNKYGQSLGEYAKQNNKKQIILGGVALGGEELNTCVDSTAIDFRAAGYEVVVLEDATKAIKPDEIDGIRYKLVSRGIEMITLDTLIARMNMEQRG